MEGGKLIGTGSMSCVFNPNLPCLNGNEKDIKSTKIYYVHWLATSRRRTPCADGYEAVRAGLILIRILIKHF